MIRKIVKIDEEKCNGCGLCIGGCHEGALKLVDGKAKLISDSYCDGLGACLPACPQDAIAIIERDAAEFDEELVKRVLAEKENANPTLAVAPEPVADEIPSVASRPGSLCGCPGSMAKKIQPREVHTNEQTCSSQENSHSNSQKPQSRLSQWPCQIKLVNPSAPYFANAHLLVAADCSAFAYANIHEDFIKNKVTIIGCPKLDSVDYSEKLSDIIKLNNIKSITVLRMEVPCCGGITQAVKNAIIQSGKMLPWSVVTISINGDIIEE